MDHTRILIVDDDFLAREMTKGLLELMECSVIGEAVDGIEAIELAQRLRPDVILMDVDMPKMNGFQATRRIRNSYSIPVVILTAYDCPHMAEEARLVGATACLNKPPLPYELKQVITQAIALKRSALKNKVWPCFT